MKIRSGGVRGLNRLSSNMRSAARTFNGPALDTIMQDSLQPLVTETVDNARALRDPENPNPPGGHLDQGVVAVKVRSPSRFRRVWWVSFSKRARKIAHLVEFGTAPHDQPRRGIRHPGATPKPFFRRAFETKKQAVFDLLVLRILRRISTSIKQ